MGHVFKGMEEEDEGCRIKNQGLNCQVNVDLEKENVVGSPTLEDKVKMNETKQNLSPIALY